MIPSPPPKRPSMGFVYAPPYRIQGISIAGEQTVVQVPELDICFDIGSCPGPVLTSPYVALSHGHMDHAAAMAYYFSQRQFQGMGHGTLLCPQPMYDALTRLMDAWVHVEGQRTPYKLLSMSPEQEYEIKPKTFLRAFKTVHTTASLGYSVVEKRTKLKPELQGLSQDQIVERKKAGEEIVNHFEVPLIAYTGDTMWGDWTQRDDVLKAGVLICECTFMEPGHRQRARAGKHLHIDHVVDLIEMCEAKTIILTHVSRRTGMRLAKQFMEQAIPAAHRDRVCMLMDIRGNRQRYDQQLQAAGLPPQRRSRPVPTADESTES